MKEPLMPGAAPEHQPEKKFWEGPYPQEQAPLRRIPDLPKLRNADDKKLQQEIDAQNKFVRSIEKMAQDLKDQGYEFELTDDESEYVLRVKGFKGITCLTKVSDPRHVDIKGIIFTHITQSGKE